MKWFRLYSEVRHDRKVRGLSNEVFRFWINCLSIASEQSERGTLPPADEIALDLKIRRDVAVRFLKELIVGGFLHPLETIESTPSGAPDEVVTRSFDGRLTVVTRSFEPSNEVVWTSSVRFKIHGWESRQPSRDDSAERVKNHRAKTSAKSAGDDVTRSSRFSNAACNADVTPPRVCAVLDTDTDTENSPLYTPPQTNPAPQIREPADLADIHAAIRFLAADLTAEAVALELGRRHNSGELIGIAGWKWLRAARTLLGPTVSGSKRRSFAYLATIAENLTDADRAEKPAAKRESPAQRKRREWKEKLARQIELERTQNQEAQDGHK